MILNHYKMVKNIFLNFVHLEVVGTKNFSIISSSLVLELVLALELELELELEQPFFNFFIMTDTDISFPLTLRKPESQTLGRGGQ